MDKEGASYILKFFSRLLNENEAIAMRHEQSMFKLNTYSDKDKIPAAKQVYLQKGWLSNDPEVLNLLDKGYDIFEFNVADRIIKEHPNKVLFNTCPKCGKLARTPQAKQCRFCGHGWHEKIVATFQVLYAFQISNRPFYLIGELLTGRVKIGMKIDLTILGIGQKPIIEAIDFSLHREEFATWEDVV